MNYLLAACGLVCLSILSAKGAESLLLSGECLSYQKGNATADSDTLDGFRRSTKDWYVQLSIGFISREDIGTIFSGGLGPATGRGAGEVYSLTVNRVAHRFEIPVRGGNLQPQFEVYGRLTLVNEEEVFLDYNAGFGFRWVDFPWNRWVDTSFFMGVGLSYSSRVYTIDRLRHPGEDRSHLKFDWPIQLILALPRWPEHQVVLLVDHQSGGHVFDEGGVNAVGFGYQFRF